MYTVFYLRNASNTLRHTLLNTLSHIGWNLLKITNKWLPHLIKWFSHDFIVSNKLQPIIECMLGGVRRSVLENVLLALNFILYTRLSIFSFWVNWRNVDCWLDRINVLEMGIGMSCNSWDICKNYRVLEIGITCATETAILIKFENVNSRHTHTRVKFLNRPSNFIMFFIPVKILLST